MTKLLLTAIIAVSVLFVGPAAEAHHQSMRGNVEWVTFRTNGSRYDVTGWAKRNDGGVAHVHAYTYGVAGSGRSCIRVCARNLGSATWYRPDVGRHGFRERVNWSPKLAPGTYRVWLYGVDPRGQAASVVIGVVEFVVPRTVQVGRVLV